MIPVKLIALLVAVFYTTRNQGANQVKLWQYLVQSIAITVFFVLSSG